MASMAGRNWPGIRLDSAYDAPARIERPVTPTSVAPPEHEPPGRAAPAPDPRVPPPEPRLEEPGPAADPARAPPPAAREPPPPPPDTPAPLLPWVFTPLGAEAADPFEFPRGTAPAAIPACPAPCLDRAATIWVRGTRVPQAAPRRIATRAHVPRASARARTPLRRAPSRPKHPLTSPVVPGPRGRHAA